MLLWASSVVYSFTPRNRNAFPTPDRTKSDSPSSPLSKSSEDQFSRFLRAVADVAGSFPVLLLGVCQRIHLILSIFPQRRYQIKGFIFPALGALPGCPFDGKPAGGIGAPTVAFLLSSGVIAVAWTNAANCATVTRTRANW